MDPRLSQLLAEGEPDDDVAVLIRLAAPGDQPPPQARVVARSGTVLSARVTRSLVPEVRDAPQVLSVKAPWSYQHEDEPEPSAHTSESTATGRRAERA